MASQGPNEQIFNLLKEWLELKAKGTRMKPQVKSDNDNVVVEFNCPDSEARKREECVDFLRQKFGTYLSVLGSDVALQLWDLPEGPKKLSAISALQAEIKDLTALA